MPQATYSTRDEKIQEFYDQTDTDLFYRHISGGEDVHVGIYKHREEDLKLAKRRTVTKMASLLDIKDTHHILDLGAGYGGTARYLAQTLGCAITCLNISKIQNQVNQAKNQTLGLNDKISVLEGSFENIPFATPTFDYVWSQDALFHSDTPENVFREVKRVLKQDGQFVFSTIMMNEQVSEQEAQKVYDFFKSMNMKKVSTLTNYRTVAKATGFGEVQFLDMSENVEINYYRLLKKLDEKSAELTGLISEPFVHRMKERLNRWADAGKKGYIKWGMLHLKHIDV